MIQSTICLLSLLGLPTALAAGFYGKGSPVLEVDASSYQSLIAGSNHTSIVEFYAPWCGHCQNLKPAYTKAAESLAGLAKVAAVNCDEEINKPLCGQLGIKGFPTLKIVKRGEKRPIVSDYNGARTAKAIVDELLLAIPNKVKTLKDKDVSSWVEANDKPKAILFSDKGVVKPMLKALAIDFLDVVDFAQIRNTEKQAASTYSVTKFPSLVLLPSKGADPIAYDGELKKAAIIKFLAKVATPNPDPAPKAPKAKKSAAAKKSEASKASSTFKVASKAAKSTSLRATQTEEVLEDQGTPTDSPSPEVDAPKPVDIPVPAPPKPVDSIRETLELQQACLNNKAKYCLLLLHSKEPSAAFEPALGAVAELRAAGEKAGRPLFPVYQLSAESPAVSDLLAKLSLDTSKSHLIVVNAKRGWYTSYTEASYSVSSLQNWVSAIKLGDVSKTNLPKDVIVDAAEIPAQAESKAPPRPSPTAVPGSDEAFEEAMGALRDLHGEMEGGMPLDDISDEDFQKIINGAIAEDAAAEAHKTTGHEEL